MHLRSFRLRCFTPPTFVLNTKTYQHAPCLSRTPKALASWKSYTSQVTSSPSPPREPDSPQESNQGGHDLNSSDIIVNDVDAKLKVYRIHRKEHLAFRFRRAANRKDPRLPPKATPGANGEDEPKSSPDKTSKRKPTLRSPPVILNPKTEGEAQHLPEKSSEECFRNQSSAENQANEAVEAVRPNFEDKAVGTVQSEVQHRLQSPSESGPGRTSYHGWHWPADSIQFRRKYGVETQQSYLKNLEVLEYGGGVVKKQLDSNEEELQRGQRPWLLYRGKAEGDARTWMSTEIKAFEAYMSLTQSEEKASECVYADVTEVLRPRFGQKSITVLGSRKTGLATPLSDFDFNVDNRSDSAGEDNSEEGQETWARKRIFALPAVRRLLRRSLDFFDIELVRARVNIVKATHRATGLAVQFQSMTPHDRQHGLIANYLTEFPALRPIYMLLRSTLADRCLNNTREGGLGSYSTLIMVVTALKFAGDQGRKKSLADQFLNVLSFWGKADLYRKGFSADPPLEFSKQDDEESSMSLGESLARAYDAQLCGIKKMKKYDAQKPYLLCLQDPADYTNDLGRNAYAIKNIQLTFRYLYKDLLDRIRQLDKGDDPIDESHSFLIRLVQSKKKSFEAHRSRVERSSEPRQEYHRDYSTRRLLVDQRKRANAYAARNPELQLRKRVSS